MRMMKNLNGGNGMTLKTTSCCLLNTKLTMNLVNKSTIAMADDQIDFCLLIMDSY